MSLIIGSTNPFASHRTCPGALPLHLPTGTSVESLVARLRKNYYRGQIVGPHGSGKTTLLATLIPAIEGSGIHVRAIALHDGQRRLPSGFLRSTSSDSISLLVVDGFEQLSHFSWLKLNWRCWRRGWGLLVTTHTQVVGLPVLISLTPTIELMRELLNRLLAEKKGTFYFLSTDSEPAMPSDQKVECPLFRQAEISFRRHAGNLREVWFDLYDRHERQVRDNAACRVLPCAGE